MSRTNTDFSKHILYETHYTNPITGHNLDVWELKIPDTMWYRVIFINSCGVLTVDGDYGRYTFCREFHPSAKGGVSDSYWTEKMRMDSRQTSADYDPDRTDEELKELIESGLEDYGWEGEELEKAKEFFKELRKVVDDEIEYTYRAYRDCPIDFDYEYIPFCKTVPVRLEIVFDAFDWICKMLKE